MQEQIWHRSYDKDVPPEIDFKEIVLPEFLNGSAGRYPNTPAVHFLNCTLTFRELKDDADRFATALAALGVRKGSKVAIHLPNLPQTVIAIMGTLALGAQVVMTNPLYVRREIEHQWNDAGCDVAVTADYLFDQRLKGMRDRLPVRHYIVASIHEYLKFPLKQLAPVKLRRAKPHPLHAFVEPGPGIHFFSKMIRSTEPNPPHVDIAFDDLAVLQYTGGTTGLAKGAMLSHRNLSCNVQQIRTWFPNARDGKEVVLAALPFFHIFGLTVCMLWALSSGAALVLAPNPRDVKSIIRGINKHRVSLFPAVPAMFNAINQYPGVEKIDISSIKSCFSGSAPLPLAVLQRFEELTGCRIVEGYGLTETSPVTHVNPLSGVRKIGSVGIPVSNTEIKVVDAKDGKTEVAVGEEGELLIRGPQVMKGYWNYEFGPGLEGDNFRKGWLHTGDLVALDEDGYCLIVGRKKDMIIASGYNIYPDEIDQELMAHPAILETCTIGIPDPKRGESVKSFVVLKPGQSVTEKELIDHLRVSLAAYKVPRMIEFRQELPKSSMMKLLRRELRDEELERLDLRKR